VTGNAWAIARIIEPHVARVIVVSPSDTGLRQARAKTDRLDARALAKLLGAGELDGVWTPDERIRAMRRRLARRAQLVRARSRAKNEIHAVLMRCLKDRPPASDLFGVEGRRWLAEQQLAVCERETVDSAVRQVEFLDTEIAEVEKLIAAEALSWPEVRRLMTIPKVNVIVAATFMAAVGDIRRFGDRRKLTAYLGLDPRVRQSGAGPANHGHISKQGSSSARHALVEACWSTVRQPGPIAAFYQHQGPSRPLDRDRRQRPQARLSVLVPADTRRGLRLRPAVADHQEAAPPRARRRRARPAGRPRRLVDQPRDAPRRARTRPPSPARLPAHGQRPPTKQGRERDSGPRISWLLKRAGRAADPKAQVCALTRRRPRPTQLSHERSAPINRT
jgi:transposase